MNNQTIYAVMCDFTQDRTREPEKVETTLCSAFSTLEKANERVRANIKGEHDAITGIDDGEEPNESAVTYESITPLSDGTVRGLICNDCDSQWEYYITPITLDK